MKDKPANSRQGSSPEPQSAAGSRAFTLTELVVAIGVIALLAATLLPALAGTKFRDQLAMCTANCRQWGVGMTTYSSDHNDYFPNEPLPGTSGPDVWDVANSFLPDMAAYGLSDPKMWFCPVRSWAYQQDNSIIQAQLGHPMKNVTNDVAYLFAWPAVFPNSEMELLVGGNNFGGQQVMSAGYMPWTKRPWLGTAPPTYLPSIYLPNGNENPYRNSPYEWLQKSSDPHAAVMPVITDIVISSVHYIGPLNALGLKAIGPGQGHPAGPSLMGAIQGDNLTFGDGHVETHQANAIQWQYIGFSYASFY